MIGKRDEPVYPSSTTGTQVTFQMGTHNYNTGSIILSNRIENDTY